MLTMSIKASLFDSDLKAALAKFSTAYRFNTIKIPMQTHTIPHN